jgi:hypothetical protein
LHAASVAKAAELISELTLADSPSDHRSRSSDQRPPVAFIRSATTSRVHPISDLRSRSFPQRPPVAFIFVT